jgi:hypothetical protein
LTWDFPFGLGLEYYGKLEFENEDMSNYGGYYYTEAYLYYAPPVEGLNFTVEFDITAGKGTLAGEDVDFKLKDEGLTITPEIAYTLPGIPLTFDVKAELGGIGKDTGNSDADKVTFTPTIAVKYRF